MSETDTGASAAYETRAEALGDSKAAAKYWLDALALSGKEEKKWRDTAKKAVQIHDTTKKSSFNILHSNTETICAASYNSTPVPDIRTRFGDRADPARKGALILERGISYQLDEYDFDDVLKKIVKDAVLPGRGVPWVTYKPLMRTVVVEDDGGTASDGTPIPPQPVIGEDGQPVTREEVVWQSAQCERISYENFRRGPGEMWSEVPWVARRLFLTRDEIRELPGIDPKTAEALPLDASDTELMGTSSEREKSPFKKSMLWQVWDKASRKVFYVSEGFTDGLVAVEDDPLNLLDFLPVPRPLMPIGKGDGLTPVTPYEIYREQAEELNIVTDRIKALVAVLKFRGIRASEIEELDGLGDLDDGQFRPSKGAMSAMMGGARSLDDAVWVMPIDKIIPVIRELYLQREQIKTVIFELTGMADILRGSVNPNEKLGQSELKAQWGSLRIAELQKDIQRLVRDIFRMKGEIIAGKFTRQTLSYINGEPVDDATMQVLRQDVQRCYQIDIETDSTIRGDLTRSQQNMNMFLQGTAQFAQSMGPLIATPNNPAGVVPPDLAIAVFAGFARQFKLGKEVEDKLAQAMEKVEQMGQQRQDPQAEQDKAEAKAIQKAGAIANVEGKQIDNAKKEAEAAKSVEEVQGQRIENAQQAAAIMQPFPAPTVAGFVQ